MERLRRAARLRRETGIGDDGFMESLVREHRAALLGYATGLTGDRRIAEDIVQEALLRAWRHQDALADPDAGSVRGWLFTVVRNLVIDRERARRARPAEVAAEAAQEPSITDHAQAVADAVSVRAALEHLSPDHRAVVEELYFRGRSMEEAAVALGVPPGTVKSRSYYALRALREHLPRA